VRHPWRRAIPGPGAKELFDLLEERQADVGDRMGQVKGFVSYALVRTDDGGISVTVCQDKEGSDQSVQLARDRVQANATGFTASPPTVAEGPVILHMG